MTAVAAASDPPNVRSGDARRIAARVLALSTRSPREALALARRALASAAPPASEQRARLLRASGHALRAVGDYEGAREAYLESRRIFGRLELPLERAIGAIGLVDACMYLGRTHEALLSASEARRVFGRRRDLRRLAMLETNLGNLLHRAERLEDAQTHYERASTLLRRVGSPVERASVDHNRANVLIHLGRRAEAEALFVRAIETFEGAGEDVLATQARYGIACLRFLSGEYAAAIAELEEVRPRLIRRGARPLLALADLDLAEVLSAIRLHPESLALARSAARWFKRRRVPVERARCLLTAGVALAHLDRHREARRALDEADRIFRRQGMEPGRAAVALGRARLEARAGRASRAAVHALRAYRAFARSGFALRALAAGATAAEAMLADGRPERAGVLARSLLHHPVHVGDAYSRARLARVEGGAAARRGDPAAALRAYRDALGLAARSRQALFVDEWRVGFLEGEPAILEEALEVLLDRRPTPRPREIWRWLTRFGAGGARPRAVTPPVDRDLRRRVEGLRAELEACYARLWRQPAHGARRVEADAVRRIERRALVLEGRLRRLAAVRHPTRPRMEDAEPPTGEQADGVRIVYFAAGPRLCALRRDARGTRVARDLAPLEEVGRRLRLFHYQMEAWGGGSPIPAEHGKVVARRARGHLEQLGRSLLEPVLAPGERPSRVLITPYGPLFRAPFHALPVGGVPLIETSEVAIETRPGPAVRNGAGRRGALVMAHALSKGEAIETEARAVARALESGGVAVSVRTGNDARSEALEEHAARVALVHLAGHAVYRREHPEFSALKLGGGWLHARDLASLPLHGAVVVLSACETGPRGVVAGDEMLGLVRGLEIAGARSVIASLWPVGDRETLAFMRDLYRAWSGLGRLGAALREVQRRASGTGSAGLHTWAPFALVGDPSAPWPGDFAEDGR